MTMLILLATCYLVGQTLFSVPEGWRVTEVYSGGHRAWSNTLTLTYCPPDCEAQREKPYVKLVREIHPGTTVEAPQGCQLTIVTNKEGP